MKLNSPVRDKLFIIGLFEAVVFCLIWLWNEYVATYLTIIFPAIFTIILILSAIADWIEPSRIPSWYYKLMIISIFIPLLIGGIFFYIYDGRFDFLSQ
ncbi:MAG TPA: hypothetical protein VMZ69_03090 [Saprospiraceae bacterium]|nr:hypothetical protein [Saprospiraceae bacterium]